jgi:hypothetical protein
MSFFETYTVVRSDGAEFELLPGGGDIEVAPPPRDHARTVDPCPA